MAFIGHVCFLVIAFTSRHAIVHVDLGIGDLHGVVVEIQKPPARRNRRAC